MKPIKLTHRNELYYINPAHIVRFNHVGRLHADDDETQTAVELAGGLPTLYVDESPDEINYLINLQNDSGLGELRDIANAIEAIGEVESDVEGANRWIVDARRRTEIAHEAGGRIHRSAVNAIDYMSDGADDAARACVSRIKADIAKIDNALDAALADIDDAINALGATE